MGIILAIPLILLLALLGWRAGLRPSTARLKEKRDVSGLVRSLAYWIHQKDYTPMKEALQALEELGWKPTDRVEEALAAYAQEDWWQLKKSNVLGGFYCHPNSHIPKLDIVGWSYSDSAEFIVQDSHSDLPVGQYTDGTRAVRQTWKISIFSQKLKTTVASKTFMGGAPPSTKYGRQQWSISGNFPYDAVKTWLTKIIKDLYHDRLRELVAAPKQVVQEKRLKNALIVLLVILATGWIALMDARGKSTQLAMDGDGCLTSCRVSINLAEGEFIVGQARLITFSTASQEDTYKCVRFIVDTPGKYSFSIENGSYHYHRSGDKVSTLYVSPNYMSLPQWIGTAETLKQTLFSDQAMVRAELNKYIRDECDKLGYVRWP